MTEGILVANEKWYSFRALPAEEQRNIVRAKRASGMTDVQIQNEFEVNKRTWQMWVRQFKMWVCGHACPKNKMYSKRSDTLCWECKNACGGCSWSHNLEPVEGWTVVETGPAEWMTSVQKMVPSVTVKECPEFIRDRRCK